MGTREDMLSPVPSRAFLDAASLGRPATKELLAASMRDGGTMPWPPATRQARQLLTGGLVRRVPSGGVVTRRGRAAVAAISSGAVPITAETPMPADKAAARVYGKFAYRTRYAGRVLTSNIRVSPDVGDRSARIGVAEFGDFSLPDGAGADGGSIGRECKATRVLKAALSDMVPASGSKARRLHPIMADRRRSLVVLAAFIGGGVSLVTTDRASYWHVVARFGDGIRISCPVSALDGMGGHAFVTRGGGEPISILAIAGCGPGCHERYMGAFGIVAEAS